MLITIFVINKSLFILVKDFENHEIDGLDLTSTDQNVTARSADQNNLENTPQEAENSRNIVENEPLFDHLE